MLLLFHKLMIEKSFVVNTGMFCECAFYCEYWFYEMTRIYPRSTVIFKALLTVYSFVYVVHAHAPWHAVEFNASNGEPVCVCRLIFVSGHQCTVQSWRNCRHRWVRSSWFAGCMLIPHWAPVHISLQVVFIGARAYSFLRRILLGCSSYIWLHFARFTELALLEKLCVATRLDSYVTQYGSHGTLYGSQETLFYLTV